MIIGFDGSRAFTKNRTGTENYSFQLLKHLARVDHTNKYYIFLRPDSEAGNDPETHWPSNFELVTLPYPRLWTQLGLAKETFTRKLDVLFIPAHTLPLIRQPGLKTIVTVHDLGAEYLPKTHQLKQRLYLNLMTHYQLKSATHLIAVSEATKTDLIKRISIPKEKISVVYEGYNQQLFQPVKNDALNNTLKEYDLVFEQYFLFVGTIQPRKNLARLIKAYAQALANNNQLPLLALAGGKGWLSDEIYTLPKKLDIENHVRFLGYIPDEDLPALYSGAKAFLFPSLFEGFGLPIIEAMAVGCPVVTSNLSSMPEVAGDAAILVDPYSVPDICQGIQQIASEEKQAALVKAGFAQVKKFSWEKCARETLEILIKFHTP